MHTTMYFYGSHKCKKKKKGYSNGESMIGW
jgi:hypothetical protein